MSTVETIQGEQRMLLSGVRWSTYVALADENQSGGKRLTYDCGDLEIMSPMMPHESAKRLLARMIDQFTLLKGIEIRSAASTTFRREDLQRGFEADESFYVQQVAAIRDKEQLDLHLDPPPDLVIEIDISRSAISKFALFAALGVPEVWRYDNQQLRSFRLEGDKYVAKTLSESLPGFPLELAENILSRRVGANETELVRQFVQAIQASP